MSPPLPTQLTAGGTYCTMLKPGWREWEEERGEDSTISVVVHVSKGIEASWIRELKISYPEAIRLYEGLRSGRLTEVDRWNLNEMSEASGWEAEDLVSDLRNLEVDPLEREEVYFNLFARYYREALKLKNKDFEAYSTQAAEKLWGAITALIKTCAARKGVFVAQWGRGKFSRFVENNVEEDKRPLFHDLLSYGGTLHEHFFEKNLSRDEFEHCWRRCCELIDKLNAWISRL